MCVCVVVVVVVAGLINEYEVGEGIMPHTDGPCYLPRVATLSLGGACHMQFSPNLRTDEVRGTRMQCLCNTRTVALVRLLSWRKAVCLLWESLRVRVFFSCSCSHTHMFG